MNELHRALLDLSNNNLDTYLEVTSTAQIRKDIEKIKLKAELSSPAGELKKAILDTIRDFDNTAKK